MPETLFKPESNLRFMGLTRKELLKKKTQILDLLPKLNSQQVRRYRLPFNEIIVIELGKCIIFNNVLFTISSMRGLERTLILTDE